MFKKTVEVAILAVSAFVLMFLVSCTEDKSKESSGEVRFEVSVGGVKLYENGKVISGTEVINGTCFVPLKVKVSLYDERNAGYIDSIFVFASKDSGVVGKKMNLSTLTDSVFYVSAGIYTGFVRVYEYKGAGSYYDVPFYVNVTGTLMDLLPFTVGRETDSVGIDGWVFEDIVFKMEPHAAVLPWIDSVTVFIPGRVEGDTIMMSLGKDSGFEKTFDFSIEGDYEGKVKIYVKDTVWSDGVVDTSFHVTIGLGLTVSSNIELAVPDVGGKVVLRVSDYKQIDAKGVFWYWSGDMWEFSDENPSLIFDSLFWVRSVADSLVLNVHKSMIGREFNIALCRAKIDTLNSVVRYRKSRITRYAVKIVLKEFLLKVVHPKDSNYVVYAKKDLGGGMYTDEQRVEAGGYQLNTGDKVVLRMSGIKECGAYGYYMRADRDVLAHEEATYLNAPLSYNYATINGRRRDGGMFTKDAGFEIRCPIDSVVSDQLVIDALDTNKTNLRFSNVKGDVTVKVYSEQVAGVDVLWPFDFKNDFEKDGTLVKAVSACPPLFAPMIVYYLNKDMKYGEYTWYQVDLITNVISVLQTKILKGSDLTAGLHVVFVDSVGVVLDSAREYWPVERFRVKKTCAKKLVFEDTKGRKVEYFDNFSHRVGYRSFGKVGPIDSPPSSTLYASVRDRVEAAYVKEYNIFTGLLGAIPEEDYRTEWFTKKIDSWADTHLPLVWGDKQ